MIAGIAAHRHALDGDNVVFVGSPGVNATSLSQLGRPTAVYADGLRERLHPAVHAPGHAGHQRDAQSHVPRPQRRLPGHHRSPRRVRGRAGPVREWRLPRARLRPDHARRCASPFRRRELSGHPDSDDAHGRGTVGLANLARITMGQGSTVTPETRPHRAPRSLFTPCRSAASWTPSRASSSTGRSSCPDPNASQVSVSDAWLEALKLLRYIPGSPLALPSSVSHVAAARGATLQRGHVARRSRRRAREDRAGARRERPPSAVVLDGRAWHPQHPARGHDSHPLERHRAPAGATCARVCADTARRVRSRSPWRSGRRSPARRAMPPLPSACASAAAASCPASGLVERLAGYFGRAAVRPVAA